MYRQHMKNPPKGTTETVQREETDNLIEEVFSRSAVSAMSLKRSPVSEGDSMADVSSNESSRVNVHHGHHTKGLPGILPPIAPKGNSARRRAKTPHSDDSLSSGDEHASKSAGHRRPKQQQDPQWDCAMDDVDELLKELDGMPGEDDEEEEEEDDDEVEEIDDDEEDEELVLAGNASAMESRRSMKSGRRNKVRFRSVTESESTKETIVPVKPKKRPKSGIIKKKKKQPKLYVVWTRPKSSKVPGMDLGNQSSTGTIWTSYGDLLTTDHYITEDEEYYDKYYGKKGSSEWNKPATSPVHEGGESTTTDLVDVKGLSICQRLGRWLRKLCRCKKHKEKEKFDYGAEL